MSDDIENSEIRRLQSLQVVGCLVIDWSIKFLRLPLSCSFLARQLLHYFNSANEPIDVEKSLLEICMSCVLVASKADESNSLGASGNTSIVDVIEATKRAVEYMGETKKVDGTEELDEKARKCDVTKFVSKVKIQEMMVLRVVGFRLYLLQRYNPQDYPPLMLDKLMKGCEKEVLQKVRKKSAELIEVSFNTDLCVS